MPLSSGPAQPPLPRYLAARWAATDQKAFALVICVHASVLFKGALQPHELLTYRLLLVAHAGFLALLLAAPGACPRHRSATISSLRLVDVLLLPLLVDMQRIHQPAGAAKAAAAAAAAGAAAHHGGGSTLAFSLRSFSLCGLGGATRARRQHAAAGLHAALLLMVAVTRLHACLAAAAGGPLPPVLHLILQAATVGMLCLRSPAVCRRYVGASNMHNAQLVEGLFWVLRQMTSTLAVGSGLALKAAAGVMSSSQKCVAVTLEISVGLVLLTLAVWRVQLGAATKYVEAARPGLQREAAGQEVASSQYAWLCAPALEAANSTGWALATALAALFGFVGGLLFAQRVE
ncbi:hypothetical protein ABPG75_013713 [Micractinium tetrahymenae]